MLETDPAEKPDEREVGAVTINSNWEWIIIQ